MAEQLPPRKTKEKARKTIGRAAANILQSSALSFRESSQDDTGHVGSTKKKPRGSTEGNIEGGRCRTKQEPKNIAQESAEEVLSSPVVTSSVGSHVSNSTSSTSSKDQFGKSRQSTGQGNSSRGLVLCRYIRWSAL
jgi:hypothetical protein